MISQQTPAGWRPAMRTRSMVASVWPARRSTPPGTARRGKVWPGCTKSLTVALGSASVRMVRARSAALMPVVMSWAASTETVKAVEQISGIAKVTASLDIADGFVTLRNMAGAVAWILIAMLLIISLFIIANTIKLATFHRREEIAIMKMVGATNGFIRWPFVYEGFMIGLLSAVLGFGLQWLLYESVAKSLAMSDRLQLLTIVDFTSIWRPVAAIFAAAGILIGVGGSLTAIRKFLHV